MTRLRQLLLLFSLIALAANSLAVVEQPCASAGQDQGHVMQDHLGQDHLEQDHGAQHSHDNAMMMADHSDCCEKADCGQCLVGPSAVLLHADAFSSAEWRVADKFLFSHQAVPPVTHPSLFRPPIAR